METLTESTMQDVQNAATFAPIVGQIVKFRAPMNDAESLQRFRVAELRGDRVLVVYVCALPLPPAYVYSVSDLQ